jgi:hypothetical protein
MGTERANFVCDFGSGRIEISGAKWFYNDANVKSACGWELKGEGQVSNTAVAGTSRGQEAKDRLVLLVAVLKPDSVLSNSNQSDRSRRFEFYCDPSSVEKALLELPEKNVDPGLGAGSYNIARVYRKRVISRR